MKKLAYLYGAEILANTKSVLIGTSAYHDAEKNDNQDIDIALTFDGFIDMLSDDCSVQDSGAVNLFKALKQTYPERNGSSVTYINGTAISKCDYEYNNDTLWEGVESITFSDDSKLDLLWYKTNTHIDAVEQTINMMKKNPYLWSNESKEARVRIFEHSVKAVYNVMVKT